MNEIQIFDYKGKNVRTVEIEGEPWFVLKDVCDILGLGTPARVAERLDEDEVSQTHLTDSLGRQQNTTIINEPGLYSVILRSDKPEAKPFQKHVTSVILPSIRKHGAYMTPETIRKTLLTPDFLIQLATQLKDEQDKNAKLTTTVNNLNNDIDCLTGEVSCLNRELTVKDKVIEQKDETIKQSKPKVEFYDAVSDTKDCIKVREFAKLCHKSGIDIGQNKLYKWFRNNGYMNSNNEPYQQYINAGYFIVREFHFFEKDEPKVSITPYITGKGQQYFLKKLKSVYTAA